MKHSNDAVPTEANRHSDQSARDYVDRWFWTLTELATAAGTEEDRVLELIAGGCAPGPVYARSLEGDWWSALSGYLGEQPRHPPQGAEHWYTPAAIWGLRRAILALRGGHSVKEAAELNRDAFKLAFLTAIGTEPNVSAAYPASINADGGVNDTEARRIADQEWDAWLFGADAVCLRSFTAETCIRKERLGAEMRQRLDNPREDGDNRELLDMAEELGGLMLPFAPWERHRGTPGRTIDRLLHESALGQELPYRQAASGEAC